MGEQTASTPGSQADAAQEPTTQASVAQASGVEDSGQGVVIEGRIHQINLSRGGVPKLPVERAQVETLGIVGDGHDDIEDHGGPFRALCIYTLEQIERLRAEGHPFYPGAAGENITLVGVPLAALTPGARLTLGDEVEAQITFYAAPCKTIKGVFRDGIFTRISDKVHPGESRVYARVLRGGAIQPGDAVRLTPLASRVATPTTATAAVVGQTGAEEGN